MKDKIEALIKSSIDVKQKLLEPVYIKVLEDISEKIIKAYKSNKKVLVCGNGGSAADSQHFVAELICRFEKNRKALPAIALTTNTSSITAIGNDFSFEDVFSRQVEAYVQQGDVVVGISTSGNSPNVIKAMETARNLKAVTVGFAGDKECKLKKKTDICFCAPSPVTARIQECHELAIHIICSLIEGALFGEK